MPEEIPAYERKIRDLLSCYVDGQDVFKAAEDWTHPLVRVPEAADKDIPDSWLELVEVVFGILAREKYGLKTYPNQISIIDSEQMLDAYSSVGMPVFYDHWSFGKERISNQKSYDMGRMGLAYEIVINTNPAIAYCMSQNSKTMQMLVIAHASFGHNSFFRNNHLFRQFTQPEEIIGDLLRIKQKVREYETKHGVLKVEKILDAAHALETHGVNRYNKPKRRTPQEEEAYRNHLEDLRSRSVDFVIDRTAGMVGDKFKDAAINIPADLEENILKFIAANAPHLEPWQRDLISEISGKAQYFYPQRQTQLMNEGWATFWHHTLMYDLSNMGLVDSGMMLEFLQSHTNVVFQPEVGDQRYSGINPYAMGFAMFKDIQRICTDPTDEDRAWFPQFAGCGDWVPVLMHAMESFKDESFVHQYLSPKVMRDFTLFSIRDDQKESEMVVNAIHDRDGYRQLREDMASQYRLSDREPRIEVAGYDYRGNRALILRHMSFNDIPLHDDDTNETLKHAYALWGHPVILQSLDREGKVIKTLSCPPNTPAPKNYIPGIAPS